MKTMSVRRKRLLILLLSLLVLGVAAALVVQALRSNMVFFYTPTQILQGETKGRDYFRLGGMVVKDSVQQIPGEPGVRFTLTDNVNQLAVTYTGVLPDLFQEGTGAVAQGHWNGQVFEASEVLAKHDENYMAPELQEALDKVAPGHPGQGGQHAR